MSHRNNFLFKFILTLKMLTIVLIMNLSVIIIIITIIITVIIVITKDNSIILPCYRLYHNETSLTNNTEGSKKCTHALIVNIFGTK
jgi:hypothetical protein